MVNMMDTMAIMYDLDDLKAKIEAVGVQLRGFGDDEEEEDPITPTRISKEATKNDEFKQVMTSGSATTIKVSRLASFRSKFRLARKPSITPTVNLPDCPSEQLGSTLQCSVETLSDDSETTLVENLPYRHVPKKETQYDAHYLTLLAPLVATIQRLSPLVQETPDNNIRAYFLGRCTDFSDLLKDLKQDTLFSSPHLYDEGTDDMRLLLLNALHRKVILEQSRCATPRLVIPKTLGTIDEIKNPFILHSSALGGMSSLGPRTPSPPKPIALAPPVYDQAGSFSEFMGHSQQAWRMNVHRLGSFQASALFSPSPIAVNRALKIGATRL